MLFRSNSDFSCGDKSPEKIIGWRLKNLRHEGIKSRKEDGVRGWEMSLKDIVQVMESRDFPMPDWKELWTFRVVFHPKTRVGGSPEKRPKTTNNCEKNEKNHEK